MLSGITVVALEQAVSAPMCTRVLSDFGARVIKVENPKGGDFARHYDDVVLGPGGLAAHFVWCNRNKESVALDLKSAEGLELLHRLLAVTLVVLRQKSNLSLTLFWLVLVRTRCRKPKASGPVSRNGLMEWTCISSARFRPTR